MCNAQPLLPTGIACVRMANVLHTARPLVLVLCGGIATAKSLLGHAMERSLGFTVHNDFNQIRREMFGLWPFEAAPRHLRAEMFSGETIGRVYDQMLVRAAQDVEEDGISILDGVYNRAHRIAVWDWALQRQVKPFFIECQCDADVVQARIAARRSSERTTSDADWKTALEIAEHYSSTAEDLKIPPRHRKIIDTNRGLDAVFHDIADAITAFSR